MERSTRHVYDNADRLRMIEDAQGGRRYRFYDAAGRLEYQVDATGAVTRLEHGATGQPVRPIQYVNRAVTETLYDSASGTLTKAALTAVGQGRTQSRRAGKQCVATSRFRRSPNN